MKLWTRLLRVFAPLSFVVGCASIPEPAGPHEVGTMHFDFDAPSGRKLEVRAWYPAAAFEPEQDRVRLPAFEPALATEMASMFNMPKFAFGDEDTGATIDAAIADGLFPVLLFNHGFGSFGKQNASQFEDLARNGFVVLSLHHPGDTLLTTYEDGTTVVADRTQPPFLDMQRFNKDPKPILDVYQRLFPKLRAAGTDRPRQRKLMQELSRSVAFKNYDVMVERWVEDTLGVLGALPTLNRTHATLRGHLDAENVGLFGHSLGGVVMGRAAQVDNRAKAVMLYDSPMLDFTSDDTPVPVQRIPTCFTYADAVSVSGVTFETNGINDAQFSAAPAGSCSVFVKDSAHYNFSDMNNTPMLKWTSMLGDVDNEEMALFLRVFTRQYFLHHMQGTPRPTVDANFALLRWKN